MVAPVGSRQMHEIRPRLFLGSVHAAADRVALAERGITHVLSVMECDIGHRQRVRLPASEADPCTRLLIAAPDIASARLDRHFDVCSAFISEGLSKGSVLVHCRAGQSRSPTVVIAHLMREEGWAADRALRFIQERRPSVQPNAGFMEQLRALEVRLDIQQAAKAAVSDSVEVATPNSKDDCGEADAAKVCEPGASDGFDEAPEAPSPLNGTGAEALVDDAIVVSALDVQVEVVDLFGAKESRLRSERFRTQCRRLNAASSLLSVAAPLRKRRYRG